MALILGDVYRDKHAHKKRILWHVYKVLPFQTQDEAEVLEEGNATNYKKAAEELAAALEKLGN